MSRFLPGPAYRIETPHLVLRCWQPADAPLLEAAITQSLDHLRPWMPWSHSEPEELQAKVERLRLFRGQFDLGQDFIYGIFTPDEREVVGGTGLHMRRGADTREIGYWLHQGYIGQGLATEATAALVRVAFEIDHVQRVEIHCDPANLRSAAIPARLGFSHEGTLRQTLAFLDQPPRDRMVWSLLAREYAASPAAAAELAAFDVLGRIILAARATPQ